MAFFVFLGDSLRHDFEKDASFNFFCKKNPTFVISSASVVNLRRVAMFPMFKCASSSFSVLKTSTYSLSWQNSLAVDFLDCFHQSITFLG